MKNLILFNKKLTDSTDKPNTAYLEASNADIQSSQLSLNESDLKENNLNEIQETVNVFIAVYLNNIKFQNNIW